MHFLYYTCLYIRNPDDEYIAEVWVNQGQPYDFEARIGNRGTKKWDLTNVCS